MELNPQQRLIVNQKLINNSSTCYVNASVMLLLWQAAGTAWHSLPEAWQVQLEKLQWNPAGFLRFSMMGWRDLHMQHDAGEYLSFILPKLGWTACMIQWSCRIQAGDDSRTLAYNAKSNTQLLALDPPEGLHHPSLQVLVNDWHQQAQIHALDSEVAHLLLQIPRFQVTEEGAVHKHSLLLNFRSTQNIQIPVFVEPDSITVRWVSFAVNSMVVHEGPTPQVGHYRTALMHPNRTGAFWYTDDGTGAYYEAHMRDSVMSNCYILSCVRCGSTPLLQHAGEGPNTQSVR